MKWDSGVVLNWDCNLFDETVLSDRSKRMMYDAGLYSCDGDEEDTEVGIVFGELLLKCL